MYNKYEGTHEGRGDTGTMIVMKNEAKIALQAVPRKGSLVMVHRQWCERDTKLWMTADIILFKKTRVARTLIVHYIRT